MASAIGSFSNPEFLAVETFTKILDSADSDDRLSNWLALRIASTKIWKYTQTENISKWVWDHLARSQNRIKAHLLSEPHKIFQREICKNDLACKGITHCLRSYASILGPYFKISMTGETIEIDRVYCQTNRFRKFSMCKYPVYIKNFLFCIEEHKLIIAFNDGKIRIVSFYNGFTWKKGIDITGFIGEVKHMLLDSNQKKVYFISEYNEATNTKQMLCIWDLVKNKLHCEYEITPPNFSKIDLHNEGIVLDLIHERALVYKSTAM